MNTAPVVPLADSPLVINGTVNEMVITNVSVSVPAALVAVMLVLKVPSAVGVPVISPVAVFTLSPAGNPLALKLVGLLVAVI